MNRADRMLAVLASEPRPFTRAEIFAEAGFMLTNNAASELRARGLVVERTQTAGPGGETIYMYELVGSLGEPDPQGEATVSLTEGHAMPDSVSGSPSEDDEAPLLRPDARPSPSLGPPEQLSFEAVA